jgi:HSP20 family molecular chaperone IbpA
MTQAVTRKNGSGTQVEKGAPVRRQVTYTPPVDIVELPEKLVLTIDMPGVRSQDVEINFERGELTVFGKRPLPEHKGQWLVEEIEAGDYYRAFLISQDVAADKISAELKNGVLTIHLPRVEAAQPRKISVKGQ